MYFALYANPWSALQVNGTWAERHHRWGRTGLRLRRIVLIIEARLGDAALQLIDAQTRLR